MVAVAVAVACHAAVMSSMMRKISLLGLAIVCSEYPTSSDFDHFDRIYPCSSIRTYHVTILLKGGVGVGAAAVVVVVALECE